MCKIWEASTDCQAESSQPVLPSAASRRARGKHRLRDPQGFVLDTLQMIFRAQTFSIDLTQVLGPRRSHGKPPAPRGDLEAADVRAVAGRPSQLGDDRFAGDLFCPQRFGTQGFERFL